MYVGSGGGYWGELAAVPIDHNYQEAVTSVAFDGLYELVWAGTDTGRLLTFQSPTLEVYSYWPGHTQAVACLVPLPGSDCCLSVAADSALLCASGGVRRSGYVSEACELLCGCLEPGAAVTAGGAARSALLGLSTGAILTMDLATGKTSTLVSSVIEGEGVVLMRPGLGRGLLAIATDKGKVGLTDPRAGTKAETFQAVTAHTGGVAAMEVRDARIACCGYALRGNVATPDPFLKVFDVRGSTVRPLLTLPMSGAGGAPTCLAFHPQLPSLLFVGASRGGLTMFDTSLGSAVGTWQVETGGHSLTACAVSCVGEVWALGDMCGCVRLWAETDTPRVHPVPTHVQVPPHPPQPPTVSLNEWGSFSDAVLPPLDLAAGTRYLSDMDTHVTMSVGLPPRVVDPALLPSVKQVDFVGHLSNPHYVRGEPFGSATCKVAAQRNKRLDMKIGTRHKNDAAAQRADRTRKRLAEGGVLLPARFHRVEIRAQSGLKFEEFDFGFYNRTRFAGLENDLPNAYANALLQLLYYNPDLRAALLADHIPEPDAEFCLACEIAMLFRMMVNAHGAPCQAANLLRALRQMRDAAALGLLDSTTPGAAVTTVTAAGGNTEVLVHDQGGGLREWALSRRCCSLSRYILETLAKEGTAQKPPAGAPPPRSGIPQPAPTNARLYGLLERLFVLPMRQKLQCLSGPTDDQGNRPCRTRDTRIMQVDLLYPPATNKGAAKKPTPAAPTAATTPTQQPELATSPSRMSPPTHTTDTTGVSSPLAIPSIGRVITAETGSATVGAGGSGASSPSNVSPFPPTSPSQNTGGVILPPNQPPTTSTAPQPSFAELLQRSLTARTEHRAWFDESRGYAYVRQDRVPNGLPQTLVVSCAASEQSDVDWWLPDVTQVTETDGTVTRVETHRLPWALRVEVCPSENVIRVREGASAQALMALPSELSDCQGEVHDVCYQLTSVIAHVRDADQAANTSDSGRPQLLPGGRPYEGHLVAMIKIPTVYWDEPELPCPCTNPPLGAGLPSKSIKARLSGSRPYASGGGSGPVTPVAAAVTNPPTLTDSPRAETDKTELLTSTSHTPTEQPTTPSPAPRTSYEAGATTIVGHTAQEATLPEVTITGETVMGGIEGAHAAQAAAAAAAAAQQGWVLINDFAISALTASEVVNVYGGQKLPCLLHYCKVDKETGVTAGNYPPNQLTPPQPPAPVITPVLTANEFNMLCRAPPLQGTLPHGPARFRPLDMSTEAPAPGMLLALDAEFVMVGAPEKTMDAKSLEVLTRQSRLSLGRVTVLRGEGPHSGVPCIDDYVRAVEPVLDYLTRYSGLMPGDLEPSTSRHYLTTMKQAYLKLRYLVDVGCVFVGHGLKKDFRIINITIPPQQLVDTVELFSRWRQRKMSLRFLASYLLGEHIQAGVHDSAEDARTALRLYEVYKKLVADNTFQAKLDEIYAWGNRHGWEPVMLDRQGKPIPPTTTP